LKRISVKFRTAAADFASLAKMVSCLKNTGLDRYLVGVDGKYDIFQIVIIYTSFWNCIGLILIRPISVVLIVPNHPTVLDVLYSRKKLPTGERFSGITIR